MMELMKKKEDMEENIAEITDYLEQPNMPGVKGKLTDEEGFPLANIDLFEVRKMRNRLACL